MASHNRMSGPNGANNFVQVCSRGLIEDTLRIIRKGLNPNTPNKFGYRGLHLASYKNHVKLVEILLTKGANPNLTDKNKRTALHHTKSKEVIELLFRYGANPRLENKFGNLATVDIDKRVYTTPPLPETFSMVPPLPVDPSSAAQSCPSTKISMSESVINNLMMGRCMELYDIISPYISPMASIEICSLIFKLPSDEILRFMYDRYD